ncbi:MAG: phosphoribosylanthranilate isomerase [Desulfobulbus propionicus]|nr:MAG: phosphoribosylanthranilate isomerase [Desulfobulbus propionicus]PIE60287.1 MAG: phosphoribosylanthranilate isomerase [Desulfobulbus propionicus]
MIGQQRVRIKICGITRSEDAACAVQAGVDALGFIFIKDSKRYIDPEEARNIIAQLPPFVDIVGVFVDKKRGELEEIIDYCQLDLAQLHGEESPKYCERLRRQASPCQVLKAFAVNDELTPEKIEPYKPHVKGFLLDTYQKGLAGAAGKVFDWSMIKKLYLQKPFLLSGGLTVENITQALESAAPYAVDANSGLERAPGIKDEQLVKAFIRKVRQYEERVLVGKD